MMNKRTTNAWHVVVISLTFLVMLAWTWGTWPDPIVDFGRELYVPWQITQGKILYRDIAYFNGPLSPYFNALVFKILGVSLRSLEIVNLILLAALTWMIWRLWRFAANAFVATVACVVLLCIFSFLRLSGIGNYNFVTPYSHELTHGIILSFAALTCILRYLHGPRKRYQSFAAALLGLIFLTKPEVFAAAAPAICIAAMLSIAVMKNMTRLKRVQTALSFWIALPIPPLAALLLLWIKLPFAQALRGILGSWIYLFDPQITSMRFYRFTRGTLDPASSIRIMLGEFFCYVAIGVFAAALAWMLRNTRRQRRIAFAISAALMVGIFCLMNIAWEQAFRAITLLIIITTAALIVQNIRDKRLSSRRIVQIAIAIFALGLLGKIALNVRTQHYGFALAMPAMLVSVAAVLSWLPNWLEKFGCSKSAFRAAAMAVVGLVLFVHLFYAGFFLHQPVQVGGGADAFYDNQRGEAVNQILSQLAQLPPSATLAVVPEGAMINFISRRENPSGFINLMPPEVAMFGQERIVESFSSHPPDFILLVHSDPSDYGYRSFADYGSEIDRWIQTNYIPLPTAPQSMLLMQRR